MIDTIDAKRTKPLDRRSRRTRAMLQEAMLKLLETKPLNRISVTELTTIADVNRATFYAHYIDIHDMFDQIKTELIDTCVAVIDRHGEEIARNDYEPVIREIFEFANAHERLFSLLVNDRDDTLYSDLIAATDRRLHRLVDPVAEIERHNRHTGSATAYDPDLAETVRNYQFAYLSGGIINTLSNWFRSGRRESAAFMARMTATTTRMAGIESLAANLRLVDAMTTAGEPIADPSDKPADNGKAAAHT